MLTKLKVIFFHRKPRSSGNYSMEGIFDRLRKNLPKDIGLIVTTSKYESNGIFKRIYNIFEAAYRQRLGNVNHVTGDVHYLTYLLKKKRTILTIHDVGILEAKSGLRRKLIKFFWFNLPVKRSAVVTVISQSTKNELLKWVNYDPQKVVVIPNIISDKFIPSNRKFNQVKPILLQIGTAKNKNIPRLIEAIKNIPCKLEIVGQLNEQIIYLLEKNKIEYENYINLSEVELVERYNNCDMVTFISTHEGFGMPIIEANAVGRPVISGNILSIPEVAGEAACLVNPLSIGSIREGVLRIINDEKYRNDLVEKGKGNVKRFDINLITNKYLELYQSINSKHVN